MNSIYTGVSGLQANQQAVDVIANNVANVNTVAFKSGQLSFQETLVRTMSGGSSTGTNPMQIGMGVMVGTIERSMAQGNLRQTGRPLDLSVVGDGFFVVGDGMTQRFTRDGIFQLDAGNRMVMASNGYSVLGWQADPYTGALNAGITAPSALTVPIGTLYAVPTGNVAFGGNLNAAADIGSTAQTSFVIYDSLGTDHTMQVTLTRTDAGTWQWEATSADSAPGTTPGSGTLTFDDHGRLLSGEGEISVQLADPNGATNPITMVLDFSGLSQFDGANSVQAMSQDGLPMGILQNFAVDGGGVIYGSFSNGATRVIGQLALARFSNPAGMMDEGNNLWNVSPNSGNAFIQPASHGGGMIRSGFIEMSNADLATEFANLIVTQRAFQANSRSITTSDEMMQEVLSLKR